MNKRKAPPTNKKDKGKDKEEAEGKQKRARRTEKPQGCGGSNDEVSPDPGVIWFYDENREWGEFSNFYSKKQNRRFVLHIDGEDWQSTEHYFQAQKFLGPNATDASREYAKLVAAQNTPNKAAVLARQRTGGGYKWRLALNPLIAESLEKGVELREDWDEVCDAIMEKAVYAKFSQNDFLKHKLLSTATKPKAEEEGEKIENEEKNAEGEKEGEGGIILMEHTSRDCYWGDGGDGSGESMLGKTLMRVRTRLLKEGKEEKRKIK